MDFISRYFYTIANLKPVQIRYQILYRFRKSLRKLFKLKYRFDIPVLREPLVLDKWINKNVSFENNKMTFLNQTSDFTGFGEVKGMSRLWNYNLNYMDYLLQPGMDCKTGKSFINKFISDIDANSPGIEPYPMALRGINWIKFIAKCRNEKENQKDFESSDISLIDSSLYSQFRVLYDNPEYHLLGNHLLEDGISLLFGAFYFNDGDYYRKATAILFPEHEEQILSDGAHFELSPMYHMIILDRILDAVNLISNNRKFHGQEKLLSLLCSKASLMLGWLMQIRFKDGTIPRVNDFAQGISPEADEIISYARRLNIEPDVKQLKESGYRMFRNKGFELFVDYGIPGPDYIPGHAHADIFSFILHIDGRPVITDTGTSTYDAGETRTFERSTAAHNTVIIGSKEQSDMWGAFRMGRRTKPVITNETQSSITGYHTGYKPSVHTREFMIGEDGFTLKDSVTSSGMDPEALFHFDPSVKLITKGNSVDFGSGRIKFTGAVSIETDSYMYAEGFNKRIEAPLIRVRFKDDLVTEFGL